jgi:hypothetical protein
MEDKTVYSGKIFEIMPLLIKEIGHISKDNKNSFQGYMFRGIDQVLSSLSPLLVRHKVVLIPRYGGIESEPLSKGFRTKAVLALTWVASEDGSSMTTVVPGEGVDSGDKAVYKAMAGAFKYSVLQTLCVPTEEPKDAENDSPVVVTTKTVDEILASIAAANTEKDVLTIGATGKKDCEGMSKKDVARVRKAWKARLDQVKGA